MWDQFPSFHVSHGYLLPFHMLGVFVILLLCSLKGIAGCHGRERNLCRCSSNIFVQILAAMVKLNFC